MFFDSDIKGDRLPPRTLCLTYDDGPGPQTLELGRALARLGVRATFFALGSHAEEHPGVLRQLADWGHLVGNHTHTHPGLVKFLADGGDPCEELARADAAIRDALRGPVTFFRAPYGNWRQTEHPGGPDKPASAVAEALNGSELAARYVGPVNWDVSAQDWEYWARRDPPEACAAAYVAKAERVGKGIVLMHDSSEDPTARIANRSREASELMVKALLERGYRFVRLDEVPQAISATQVTDQVIFEAAPGVHLAREPGGDRLIPRGGPPEVFGLVRLPDGATALRAANGCYVSARPGGELIADALQVGPAEAFTLEELAGRFRVRRRFTEELPAFR